MGAETGEGGNRPSKPQLPREPQLPSLSKHLERQSRGNETRRQFRSWAAQDERWSGFDTATQGAIEEGIVAALKLPDRNAMDKAARELGMEDPDSGIGGISEMQALRESARGRIKPEVDQQLRVRIALRSTANRIREKLGVGEGAEDIDPKHGMLISRAAELVQSAVQDLSPETERIKYAPQFPEEQLASIPPADRGGPFSNKSGK